MVLAVLPLGDAVQGGPLIITSMLKLWRNAEVFLCSKIISIHKGARAPFSLCACHRERVVHLGDRVQRHLAPQLDAELALPGLDACQRAP